MPYDPDHPMELDGNTMQTVRDPLKLITVYGACVCGSQAGIYGALCHKAGLEVRRFDPGFAHDACEVRWDGKWHWLDVWLPCYVLDREGEIASYAQIMADKSLLSEALEQGRASPNFFFNYKDDLQTILSAKRYVPQGPANPECTYRENLCLRPGESCTWMWDNVGKWYWPGEHFPAGPAFKFSREHRMKEAFAFWKPYRKEFKGGPHWWHDVYYRYYGNAIFEYAPKLRQEDMMSAGAKLTNIAFDGKGWARPGKEGTASIAIPVHVPYVIADATVECVADCSEGSAIAISYSLDGGAHWHRAWRGEPQGRAPLVSLGRPSVSSPPVDCVSGHYDYLVRYELTGEAHLKQIKITTCTMLNFYSRPWLESGTNKVTATASNPDALQRWPLDITWRWLEDGISPGKHREDVEVGGHTYSINVGGKTRPRMVSVTIECLSK
jgi:hypothetical protein